MVADGCGREEYGCSSYYRQDLQIRGMVGVEGRGTIYVYVGVGLLLTLTLVPDLRRGYPGWGRPAGAMGGCI